MTYIVSITDGRRITIPIEFRRKLGWDKSGKLLLKVEKGKIILSDFPNDNDQKLAKLK